MIYPSSEMTTYLIKKTLKHIGLNDYVNNMVMSIGDLDGNGKYDIRDFLEMDNNDILKENKGRKFDICLMNPQFNLGVNFF